MQTFALGLGCKNDYHRDMKFLSRLLLLCLLGWGSALAQTGLPLCQGNDSTNWSSCRGTYSFPDGSKYIGEFKAGNFGGFGTFYYANGSVYIGEWFNGNRNGNGSLTYRNGTKYVGEWRDGFQNGMGVEYTAEGRVLASGTYSKGKSNASYEIDSSRFPFNTETPASLGLQANLTQSNLNACQGNDQKKWNYCIGIEDYDSGVIRKFVGIYLNGERSGLGIEYAKDGSVLRSGTWKGFYRLVTSHAVDTQRFPFNSSVFAAVSQTSIPDTGKVERDRLAADLEASRKKQQELEEQLRASQVAATQNSRPAQNMSTERRVALVIGNATYKINPLKNPVNDSTDMARSLRSVGFDVIEANNTTLAQMREATRRFADKLGNSDVGLVYYSGHGVEVKGKNYLIPVNADIKREYEVVDQAFDASQFLEMMDNIRGPNNKRVNILIVDACRNNELQRSWRSTNNGLARMDAPGGTFISFATAPGRVAADGIGRNSPYTKHLLQALKQPNVPIEQVFKVVRRNVMEETKGEQIPWENSSLVGDFYFTVQR
jgi:hypothetical protein